METTPARSYSKSRRVKPLMYVGVLLINVLLLVCIGLTYVRSAGSYSEKLFNENINTLESMNAASANAAYTYTQSMGIKIDDTVNYIKENSLDYAQAVQFLRESNTNPDRQFQLVLSGSYGATGELSFGDYTGVSIRKVRDESGELTTVEVPIVYGSGYFEMFKSLTDAGDENLHGLCFAPEFTDPDTKKKCIGVYRHVDMRDEAGQRKLYTVLLAIHSTTALNAYNMQNEYQGQSTVLIDEVGAYIIKNSDYRNANFFDYIVNYNGLTNDRRAEIQNQVWGNKTANLYYKNHRGEDCVFSTAVMENGWYSITCAPLASFRAEDDSVNYSLVILLLFLALFVTDGVAFLFIGKTMNYNVLVAKRAQTEADQANQAKSRFLSTMSHELRTPLNAIIGLTALSSDSIRDPDVLRDYLTKIDISSKLLLQLISDILDVSAIESNKMKLNRSVFDVTKLMDALTVIYREQCAVKGIDFAVTLRQIPSPRLVGDSVRVNQVLLNFLSNAVKFTPRGGQVTLSVQQIGAEQNRVTLRFAVTDTGCGVSDELKTRLFRPFERVSGDAASRYGGSGLGLSIAKSLIELMGGTIGMESKEGEGSCFWTEIPFELPTEAAPAAEAAEPALGKARHFDFSGKRVLLVEDNRINRDIARLLLQKTGFAVETAEDGQQGYERFVASPAGRFDAILMDVQMPVMNGYRATEAIRASAHPQAAAIPILAMTADAFSEDVEKARNAGMNEHLSKPIEPDTLYETLYRHLC